MGEHLADRAVVGTIQPRFTPSERISLTSQLTTAKSDLIAGTAAVSAARSAYERTKVLNADNKNVSDQVLQDAAARLQAEEARYRAANQTVQQIQASLQSADPAGSRQLVVERGGEVVELIAQPGESIEPGAPILRVAKLNQLLARIDIPVGEHVPASVTTAKIVPVGFESQPIVARRIAVALASGSAVPGQAQGEAFLFRLDNITFGLRPGVAVTAYIDSVGPLQEGVIIPQSAVVRFQGSGFAYVQTASNEFLRKQVSLDSPTGGGYFTTRNFQPGDRVVVVGAESLLSEEFKAQISDED
jgi:biotin carboxyl carrier protein